MFDFLDSEDMQILRRAIDARCKDLNIRSDISEAEVVASQLIELFQSGVTNEEELTRSPWSYSIGDDSGAASR